MKERKAQTIYLSERYSAEFKQTIEMNEHSLKQFSQPLNFPVYTEHRAVKWASFFSLILRTEHLLMNHRSETVAL